MDILVNLDVDDLDKASRMASKRTRWGCIGRMADPCGHGFCLAQFLGHGYDEVSIPPARASR